MQIFLNTLGLFVYTEIHIYFNELEQRNAWELLRPGTKVYMNEKYIT